MRFFPNSRKIKHKDKARAFISFLAMKIPLLAAASHAAPGSGNGLEDYPKRGPSYSNAYSIYMETRFTSRCGSYSAKMERGIAQYAALWKLGAGNRQSKPDLSPKKPCRFLYLSSQLLFKAYSSVCKAVSLRL
jgi:hypothetical protein